MKVDIFRQYCMWRWKNTKGTCFEHQKHLVLIPGHFVYLEKKMMVKKSAKSRSAKSGRDRPIFQKKFTENYITSNLIWPLSGFWMLHWSFWHIWIFDLRAQNKDFFKNPENQNFRFPAGKMVGREKYFPKKNLSL